MGKMLLLSFENSEDGEYGIALIKFYAVVCEL